MHLSVTRSSRSRNRLLVAGVATAVASATMLILQLQVREAVGAVPAATVFASQLPTDIASVRVLVDPDDRTLEALEVGDGYSPYELPPNAITVGSSSYEVAIESSELPDGYLNPDGVATFNVMVKDKAGESWVTAASARAVVASDGLESREVNAVWIDPMFGDPDELANGGRQQDAGGNLLPVIEAASLTSESSVVVAQPVPLEGDADQEVPDDSEPVDEGDTDEGEIDNGEIDVDDGGLEAMACGNGNPGTTYWRLLERSKRNTTIMSTYPVGSTQASAYHNGSTSGSYGIGVSTSGAFGTYKASGSKTVSGGWTADFPWYTGGRWYRTGVDYGKYRVEITDTWGDCHYHSRQWRARMETGGATSVAKSSRPNYTYCDNVSNGVKWARNTSSGTAYSWSAGVEISGKIGIDLSSKKQYSKSNSVTYQISGANKKICGDNTYASRARKQMEKYR